MQNPFKHWQHINYTFNPQNLKNDIKLAALYRKTLPGLFLNHVVLLSASTIYL